MMSGGKHRNEKERYLEYHVNNGGIHGIISRTIKQAAFAFAEHVGYEVCHQPGTQAQQAEQ